MNTPKFRIVQFNAPHPTTGHRFYIEWKINVEIRGIKIPFLKEWKLFIDPATAVSGGDYGYTTIVEAKAVIDRYRMNMQPQYHEV